MNCPGHHLALQPVRHSEVDGGRTRLCQACSSPACQRARRATAIHCKRNEVPVACPDCINNNRSQVERLWSRLKEWRAVATRYETTALSFSFMGALCLTVAQE